MSGSQRRLNRRTRLRDRDGPYCWLCNFEMRFVTSHQHDPLGATVEHLVARANEGENKDENCVLCHHICNQFLDDRPLIEKLRLRDLVFWSHRQVLVVWRTGLLDTLRSTLPELQKKYEEERAAWRSQQCRN